MIKLRVEGIPEEVDEFVATLETSCEVLSKSAPYKNRGESRYVRVYVDILPCKIPSALEKVLRWLVEDCNEDICKLCINLKESQWDGGDDIPEDVEPCRFRREGGDAACIEGICKYFERK